MNYELKRDLGINYTDKSYDSLEIIFLINEVNPKIWSFFG